MTKQIYFQSNIQLSICPFKFKNFNLYLKKYKDFFIVKVSILNIIKNLYFKNKYKKNE